MKKSVLFIGLTFLICWLIAGLYYFLVGTRGAISSIALGIFYMVVPMSVAIIIQKFVYREHIKNTLGISFRLNRWFIIAWLLPPLMMFATFGISLLLPSVEYRPNMEGMFERLGEILTSEQIKQMQKQATTLPISPIWFALFQGMIAGISVNAFIAFGEELGWRGLLHQEWKNMGFWKSSSLIGFVWGIWHAPMVLQGHNYPQHPVIGAFLMIIWCVLISPTFSYIRIRSNSVIAVSILHGTFNGTGMIAIMMLDGGNDLLIGPTGLAGFIVLVLTNIILVCHNIFWAKERIESCI